MWCLFYNIHLVNNAFATTELLYNKEYITYIHVDATLQFGVEVDVAAE